MLWRKPIPPKRILPIYPVEIESKQQQQFSDDELAEREEKGIPHYLPSIRTKKKKEKLDRDVTNEVKKDTVKTRIL